MMKRAALVFLFVVGCAPTARLSNPRVLDTGRVELVGGTSLQLVGAGTAQFPVVQIGGGARVGIGSDLEIGAGLRAFYTDVIALVGADLDLKWQLHRSTSAEEGAELALSTNVASHWLSGSGADAFQVAPSFAVLMALNLGGGDQLLAAPSVLDQITMSAGSATVHQPFVGTALGYRWCIDETFSLVPEVGMFWSPVGIEGSDGVGLVTVRIGSSFVL